MKIKPDNLHALVNKGITLGKLGCYEEALSVLGKAIKIHPNSADAIYNRACIFSMYKKTKKAIIDLSKAIELNPNFKKDAKIDEDFRNICNNDEFKRITS